MSAADVKEWSIDTGNVALEEGSQTEVVMLPSSPVVVRHGSITSVNRKKKRGTPIWVECILWASLTVMMSCIAWGFSIVDHRHHELLSKGVDITLWAHHQKAPHYFIALSFVYLLYPVPSAFEGLFFTSMGVFLVAITWSVVRYSSKCNGRIILFLSNFATCIMLLILRLTHPVQGSMSEASMDIPTYLGKLEIAWYVYMSLQLVGILISTYIILVIMGFKKSVVETSYAVIGLRVASLWAAWLCGLSMFAGVYGERMKISLALMSTSITLTATVFSIYCILFLRVLKRTRANLKISAHNKLNHTEQEVSPLITASIINA